MDQVDNVGGHALADAAYVLQVLWFADHAAERLRLLLDGLGRAAIAADTEGIGRVDFEQGGGLIEQARDGDVVHVERVLESRGRPQSTASEDAELA